MTKAAVQDADATGNSSKTRCSWLKLTKDGSTPPNWKVISLTLFAMFGGAYSITFVFPFLPSMILYLGYKEEDKGYYAGYVASAMFAGRIVGSYFWGWLSDKKGRKPVIILNLVLISICNLGFGFSTTLAEAIFWRFMSGSVNGLVGVCKTVLYEVSDSSNQAIAMSSISLMWGAGVIMGPLISGYVADPCMKYKVLEDSWFLQKFPYFLPGFIAGFVAVIPMVVCAIFLPETRILKQISDNEVDNKSKEKHPTTLSKDKSLNDEATEAEKSALTTLLRNASFGEHMTHLAYADDQDADDLDTSQSMYGLGCPSYSTGDLTAEIHMEALKHQEIPKHILPTVTESDEKPEIYSENGFQMVVKYNNHSDEKSKCSCCTACCVKFKNSGVIKILSSRDVQLVIALYTVSSFGLIGVDEILTIWASTDPTFGGLGFSSEQIGNALGLSSLPLIVLQVFLFTFLERKIGSIKICWICTTYLIVYSVSIVCLRPLHDKSTTLWPLLLTFLGIQKIAGLMCFSATALFINNSTHPSVGGSVNGLAMTVSSIARSIAPMLGGSMFAWSITHGTKIGFPFDVNLVFIWFGLVFFSNNVVCAYIPKHLERQTKKD